MTITILTLLEWVGAMDGAANAIKDLVEFLRSKGHKDSDPIPPEHQATITQVFARIDELRKNTVQDFIDNTLSR